MAGTRHIEKPRYVVECGINGPTPQWMTVGRRLDDRDQAVTLLAALVRLAPYMYLPDGKRRLRVRAVTS